MLTTRPVTQIDCEIICQFAKTAGELFYLAPTASYPWTAQQLAQTLPERLSNTVFIKDNELVGFANFYSFEPGNQAFIGNVIVNPSYRSQGVGKAIALHMLETGFVQHKFSEIHVSCFSSNTPGLLLYKKLGFTPYGIEQRTNHENKPVAMFNFMHSRASYIQEMNNNREYQEII